MWLRRRSQGLSGIFEVLNALGGNLELKFSVLSFFLMFATMPLYFFNHIKPVVLDWPLTYCSIRQNLDPPPPRAMTCFSMGELIYFQLEHIKKSHFSDSLILAKRLENNLLESWPSPESQQQLHWIESSLSARTLWNWIDVETHAAFPPSLALIFLTEVIRGEPGCLQDQDDLACLLLAKLSL